MTKIETKEFPVVGMSYHGGMNLEKIDTVHFIRETNNKFDKNAIAVNVGSLKIGYVPKNLALKLAPRLDKNESIPAKVVYYDRELGPNERLRISVPWES